VNLPTFLFLSAAAASPITLGVRDAVSSPHATMSELGRERRASVARDEKHEQRRSLAPKIASYSIDAVRAQSVVTKPSLAAPPVTAGFRGSDEDGQYPSDATGAVSATYVLQLTNAAVLVQNRSGTTLTRVPIASFWHDPAFADGALYDSRAAYDAVTERWIICALYDVGFKKSALLIAVSDGNNPTLGWHRYRYVVDPTDVLSADYTRMVLTRDAIVITADMFSSFNVFAHVFTIRKSDAYGGGVTLPVTQIQTSVFDVVPVEARDDTTMYFVAERGQVDLSIYSLINGTLTSAGSPQAPAMNLTSPVFQSVCPQLGTTFKMECGDFYVLNAVLRNGTMWVATQPFGASPLRSSVMWWRITMSSPLRVDTGLIDDPTGVTMFAFPSIAVNKVGAALIGYAVFSPTTYPSAGFTYVDPFNSMSAPAMLKSSTSLSLTSRWADYSGTVVDANDLDFWTTQTYIQFEGLKTKLWSTWWARIDMPALARGHAVRH
jgi:hypothetical protein